MVMYCIYCIYSWDKVAQLARCRTINQRVADSIPSRAFWSVLGQDSFFLIILLLLFCIIFVYTVQLSGLHRSSQYHTVFIILSIETDSFPFSKVSKIV